MGIGDWGLGIGDWGLGPIPNPQSPIPMKSIPIFNYYLKYILKIIILIIKKNGIITRKKSVPKYNNRSRK